MSLRMVVVTTAWGSYCPTFPLPLWEGGLEQSWPLRGATLPFPSPAQRGRAARAKALRIPYRFTVWGEPGRLIGGQKKKSDMYHLACLECIGSGLTGPSHIHIFIYRYTVPLQFRTDSARLAGWPLGWLSGRMVGWLAGCPAGWVAAF